MILPEKPDINGKFESALTTKFWPYLQPLPYIADTWTLLAAEVFVLKTIGSLKIYDSPAHSIFQFPKKFPIGVHGTKILKIKSHKGSPPSVACPFHVEYLLVPWSKMIFIERNAILGLKKFYQFRIINTNRHPARRPVLHLPHQHCFHNIVMCLLHLRRSCLPALLYSAGKIQKLLTALRFKKWT